MLRQIKNLRNEARSLGGCGKNGCSGEETYHTPESITGVIHIPSPPSTPLPPRLQPHSALSRESEFFDDLQMPTTTAKKKSLSQIPQFDFVPSFDLNQSPTHNSDAKGTGSADENTPIKFAQNTTSLSPDSVLESLRRSPLNFGPEPTENPQRKTTEEEDAAGVLDEDVSRDFFDSSNSYHPSSNIGSKNLLWTPARNANINPFSPEKLPSPKPPPKIIGQNIFPSTQSHYAQNFEQIESIGSGIKSTVFLCRHMVDGWLYAVKKMKPRASNLSNQSKHLLEVYALAALAGHGNIVRYYTAWIEDERLFIQMEYFKDGSVSDQRKKGVRFDEPKLCTILKHVASGLHHIHSKNMVHMNVKPTNIYLASTGEYKIGDFSLVVMTQNLPSLCNIPACPNTVAQTPDQTNTEDSNANPQPGTKRRSSGNSNFNSRSASNPVLPQLTVSLFDESPSPHNSSKKYTQEYPYGSIAAKRAALFATTIGISSSSSTSSLPSSSSSSTTTTSISTFPSESSSNPVSQEALIKVVNGDPKYLAPELIEGDYTLSLLPRVDIFALGCTVYELALGRSLPSRGEEYNSLRQGQLQDLSSFSKRFVTLLKSMLHPEPDKRPSAETVLKSPLLKQKELEDMKIRILSLKAQVSNLEQHLQHQHESCDDDSDLSLDLSSTPTSASPPDSSNSTSSSPTSLPSSMTGTPKQPARKRARRSYN